MQLTSIQDPSQADRSSLRAALSLAPLARFSQGLLATGLVEDIQEGRGPFTLLAPTDEAFSTLPWIFEDLFFDRYMIEARFDLFEYLVVRERALADGTRMSHVTLQGESVRLGNRLAYGRYGAARVLQTLESGPVVIHVLEQCIFPWDPKLWLVDRMRRVR